MKDIKELSKDNKIKALEFLIDTFMKTKHNRFICIVLEQHLSNNKELILDCFPELKDYLIREVNNDYNEYNKLYSKYCTLHPFEADGRAIESIILGKLTKLSPNDYRLKLLFAFQKEYYNNLNTNQTTKSNENVFRIET